ncbi:MAG: hypothetical protein EP338_00345 [Bacteroidetes bacterium]|nr:MAG: hypothetical protein EP338_00345 [Bacteroidota bacterium]
MKLIVLNTLLILFVVSCKPKDSGGSAGDGQNINFEIKRFDLVGVRGKEMKIELEIDAPTGFQGIFVNGDQVHGPESRAFEKELFVVKYLVPMEAKKGLNDLIVELGPQTTNYKYRVAVDGLWSGNFTWNCGGSNNGSTTFFMEWTFDSDSLEFNEGVLNGHIYYPSDTASLTGQINDLGEFYYDISACDFFGRNDFYGWIQESGNTIIGNSSNGNGCSAPSGYSGDFTMDKVQ